VEKNHTSETSKMFIAMNRFKVIKEERKAFEDLWVTRQSHLDEVKGFQAFHLLRGPEHEDHVLYLLINDQGVTPPKIARV
jgi:heme-degrading monooxygenase HmoA